MGHVRVIKVSDRKTTVGKAHKDFLKMIKQKEIFLTDDNLLIWYLGRNGRNEILELMALDIFVAHEKKNDDVDIDDE